MYKKEDILLDYDMIFSNGLLVQSWEESWLDYLAHRIEKEKLLKRIFLTSRMKYRIHRCNIHINTYESKYGIDVLKELFRAYRDKKEIPPEPESLFTYVREVSNKTEEGEEIEFDPLDDEPIKTSEELDAEKAAAESREIEAIQAIDVTMPANAEEEGEEREKGDDDRDEGDEEEGTEDGSGVDLRLVEKERDDGDVDSVDSKLATNDDDDNNIASRKDPRAETEAEEEPVCDSAAGEPAATEPFPNLEPVEDEEDWWWSDYAEPDKSRAETTEDSERIPIVLTTTKPETKIEEHTEDNQAEQINIEIEPEDIIDVEGEKFSKKYLISLYEENGCTIDFNKLSLLEIHFLEEE